MNKPLRLVLLCLAWLGFGHPLSAGELNVVGTGDGVEMLQALASRLRDVDASTEIVIPPSIGSGGGIAAVGSGASPLARVARVLSEAEVARGLVYVPVAKLPAAFFVHPSARVAYLTRDQLAAIYAGQMTNWKYVGGTDQRIRVVRREEADSTLTTFRANLPEWRGLQITERSKTAVSTQEAVESVRLVEGAIGFGPYSRLLETGTNVVIIEGRHPTHPDYPISNTLAFVHKAGALTPEAERFIAFVRTETAAEIIRSFGATPLMK